MKCPKCKKKIESVIVLSYCTQRAVLKAGTNIIEDYHEGPEAGDTVAIHCPECDAAITRAVRER